MRFFGKPKLETFGVLAIVCASICLVGAGVWAGYSYHVKATALRTRGRITQMVERHDDHGDAFYPVFEYADHGGIEHTIYSNAGGDPPAYKVGDSVGVLYSTGSEDQARLDDWWLFWGIPLVVGVLGIFYLPVGIVVLWWVRKRKLSRLTEVSPPVGSGV